MEIISLALRNVLRNWRRSVITILAMGFAGFIMIFFASLIEGLIQAGERNAVIMDSGDIQIHAFGYRDDPDLYKRITNSDELVSNLQKAGFYACPRVYGFGLAAAGSTSAGVELRGIDPTNEKQVTQINQHVFKGLWLDQNHPMGVVIGKKLAYRLGVEPGDEIIIVSQATDGSMANDLFRVRGILKSVNQEADRAGFYMLENTFRELMVMPEGVHEIAIMRPDRKSDLNIALKQVKALANGYEILTWQQLQPVIARILDVANANIIFMLLITYTAVAMVILNAMLMSVFERIHEFGVMKAIGVTPWQIIKLVYSEIMIQVMAASIIALTAGWSISSYYQKKGINLASIAGDISFGGVAMDPVWRAFVTTNSLLKPVFFLFLIASLAVIYPAFKAALIRPVQAIYYR